MSNLRNEPVDLRYLSDKDKSDFQKGGGYGEQVSAYKRARAYQGNMAYNAKRQIKTTSQTLGTGGQGGGIQMQQDRYREIGQEKRKSQSFRPDMDDSIYDIYS